MQCALCASPIAGDPDAMALICKNGHQDVVHDKCYKNRYSNEVYKKAQHGESTKYGRGPAKERCLHDGLRHLCLRIGHGHVGGSGRHAVHRVCSRSVWYGFHCQLRRMPVGQLHQRRLALECFVRPRQRTRIDALHGLPRREIQFCWRLELRKLRAGPLHKQQSKQQRTRRSPRRVALQCLSDRTSQPAAFVRRGHRMPLVSR